MSNGFVNDDACFVCGKKNPFGLKIEFKLDKAAGAAETVLSYPEHFQGWREIVHGGLLATVLDEVMIYAAAAAGLTCVTGEITVRYSKPLATGSPIKFSGRVIERRRNIVMAEAEAVDADGLVGARASGKLVVIQGHP